MIARNFFFIYRLRLRKFILKNQQSLLNISYFGILLVLLGLSIYWFIYRSTEPDLLIFGAKSLWFIGFAAMGIVNFLVAFAVVDQREKQIKNLKKLVLIDQLTGIYNKGYFLNKIQNEIVRSKRYHHILSLILVDIDHFKKLNDTYGHICGDIILRNIAKLIKKEIRLVDMACRFGGEEFAIICPETGVHEAYSIAQRIRKKIEETVFTYHKKEIKVTISAGINHLDPLKPIPENILFKGADQALYHAKNSGRNKVMIYSPKFKNFPSDIQLGASKKSHPKKQRRLLRKSKT